MIDEFVVVNGKKYRKGYTTGSCAAAAAKAAALMLFSTARPENIWIDTPAGVRLCLPVSRHSISEGTASCSVVKDGGDDPDVTSGLNISASARVDQIEGIRVKMGEGIGIATLPGLKVAVGQPAINPVPMKMILKEVSEVLPQGKGVEITLSVAGGKEAAIKTYNARLGIVGGISILGTTGIVTPMSEEAWKDSIYLELEVARAKGIRHLAMVFGNIGHDFCTTQLHMDGNRIIIISNFVGAMLDKACELGFESVLLAGHLGKLVKVAAGIFHTHSRVADGRMETLAAFSAMEGASRQTVEEIYNSVTTEGAAAIIDQAGVSSVYSRIAGTAAAKCREYVFGKLEIGTALFSADGRLLAVGGNADKIVERLKAR